MREGETGRDMEGGQQEGIMIESTGREKGEEMKEGEKGRREERKISAAR